MSRAWWSMFCLAQAGGSAGAATKQGEGGRRKREKKVSRHNKGQREVNGRGGGKEKGMAAPAGQRQTESKDEDEGTKVNQSKVLN